MPNTVNIFCIVANYSENNKLYLDELLSDKKFLSKTKLEKLIYSTTRPKMKNEDDNDFHFKTYEEYSSIPETDIVEFRSYYTLDNGTVYYFTKVEDIAGKNRNLICHASPFQYESIRRWIATQNILNPNSYALNLIYLNTNLHKILQSKSEEENVSNTEILEFCRMVIEENAEFGQASKRIPELMQPTLCSNVCYIDSLNLSEDVFNANLEKIKAFILKTINNA